MAVEVEEARDGPDGRVLLQVSGTFRGGVSGVESEVRAWELLSVVDAASRDASCPGPVRRASQRPA